jgi:hypothetical protein
MRRRLLVILPGLTTVLGLAIPAHAESGAVKDVFIEDSKAPRPSMTRPSPTASATKARSTRTASAPTT